MVCDCSERTDIEINSWHVFQEMQSFFEGQVHKNTFIDIPVRRPYETGPRSIESLLRKVEWFADKWYRCNVCGTVWEFKYPEFPAKGFVRRIDVGHYKERELVDERKLAKQ